MYLRTVLVFLEDFYVRDVVRDFQVFKDCGSYTCQMWNSFQNEATLGHSGKFYGGVIPVSS